VKKILILGSSKYFVNIVEKCKDMGVYTIVCDGNKEGIAKLKADKSYDIDIFNYDELEKIIIENNIEGIITGFSDILIKPYVKLANKLKLPCIITNEQLNDFINKACMKKKFLKFNIPTTKYKIIEKYSQKKELTELRYPLIIKPLDSSGSKGIYILENDLDFDKYYEVSSKYSTDGKVIVEEYYENEEIQGMCWINNGKSEVLYIGDRELVNIYNKRPGKPNRLLYPSKYMYQYEEKINELFQKIVDVFEVKNGILYAQFLVGEDGLKVAEIMPRLPGGCDYKIIEKMTGVSILEEFIKFSLNKNIDLEKLKKLNLKENIGCAIPIYLKSGKINKIKNINEIENKNYVFEYLLIGKEEDLIEATGDMKQDIGRVFFIANNIFDANKKTKELYKMIEIIDENEINMIENF
jgi:biotin carboxylase